MKHRMIRTDDATYVLPAEEQCPPKFICALTDKFVKVFDPADFTRTLGELAFFESGGQHLAAFATVMPDARIEMTSIPPELTSQPKMLMQLQQQIWCEFGATLIDFRRTNNA